MLSGMSDDELERMKNMASSMNPGAFGNMNANNYNAQSQPAVNTNNSASSNNSKDQSAYPHIDKFRVKGNEYFKNQNMEEA